MTERLGSGVGAGVALALGLVLASMIGGWAFVKGKRGDQSIVVTGSARKRIRSDPVIWCTSVTHQAAALADAYRSLSESVHRVKSYPRTQKKSLALALRPWRRILRRW